MLNRHELPMEREDAERVDTLRYTWKKLIAQSSVVQDELINVQPIFRKTLLENVQIFKEDCGVFYSEYAKVHKRNYS